MTLSRTPGWHAWCHSHVAMKIRNHVVLALAAVGALTVGCDPNYEETPIVQSPPAQRARDTDLNNTIPATVPAEHTPNNNPTTTTTTVPRDYDYPYVQRGQFGESMRSEMARLKADMDRLAERVDNASDAAKAEQSARLEALRQRVNQLEKDIGDVEKASESTWEDMKRSIRKSYEEVKQSLRDAGDWVDDKVSDAKVD